MVGRWGGWWDSQFIIPPGWFNHAGILQMFQLIEFSNSMGSRGKSNLSIWDTSGVGNFSTSVSQIKEFLWMCTVRILYPEVKVESRGGEADFGFCVEFCYLVEFQVFG